jgi:hypothetical protein
LPSNFEGRRIIMSRHNSFFGAFLALLFTFFLVSTVFAAATNSTIVVKDDEPARIITTCPDEGIYLSGYTLLAIHTSEDKNGGLHSMMLHNSAGLRGIGSESGDKYQVKGVYRWNQNIKLGKTYTETMTYKIMRQGTGNFYTVHQTIHYTMNANGDFTVDFNRESITCR